MFSKLLKTTAIGSLLYRVEGDMLFIPDSNLKKVKKILSDAGYSNAIRNIEAYGDYEEDYDYW